MNPRNKSLRLIKNNDMQEDENISVGENQEGAPNIINLNDSCLTINEFKKDKYNRLNDMQMKFKNKIKPK